MMRLTSAILSALLVCAPVVAGAQPANPDTAPADCHVSDDGIVCPRERWLIIRDKARGFELLCEAVGTPSLHLPAGLAELCEKTGKTSDIWARAQHAESAQETADRLQRKLNTCRGQKSACAAAQATQAEKIDRLTASRQTWKVLAFIGGGLVVVSGVAITGDAVGVWEFGDD